MIAPEADDIAGEGGEIAHQGVEGFRAGSRVKPNSAQTSRTIKIMTAPDGCRVVRPYRKQDENSKNRPVATELFHSQHR
jgi:hypothetical protein